MRFRFLGPFPVAFAAAFALVLACSDDPKPAVTPDGSGDAGEGTDGESPSDDGGPGTTDAPIATPPGAKVDTTNETVDVDGVTRKYVLSVPKTYDAKRAYPLVVALHGDGQNATNFRPFSRLEEQTGDQAILAYPDQSVDLDTDYASNKDQRLVELVIDALKKRFTIDAKKVWGFGYSKGGFQIAQIICRKPGLFTAVATHAAGAPQDVDGKGIPVCPGALALPAFVTEGSLDKGIGGDWASQNYAKFAGCGTNRKATTPTICQAYEGCPATAPVVYCEVPGQPHYPMYDQAAAHSWAFLTSL